MEDLKKIPAKQFCNLLGRFSSIENNTHTRDKKLIIKNIEKAICQLGKLGYNVEINKDGRQQKTTQ